MEGEEPARCELYEREAANERTLNLLRERDDA
jgi:hypothetical protein